MPQPQRKEIDELMITIRRISPDADVTFEITASLKVWRQVVAAIGPEFHDLNEFYIALHAEVYRLKG